jgi:hypothetical protein
MISQNDIRNNYPIAEIRGSAVKEDYIYFSPKPYKADILADHLAKTTNEPFKDLQSAAKETRKEILEASLKDIKLPVMLKLYEQDGETLDESHDKEGPKNLSFFPVPRPKRITQREVGYICAPSGSGKSVFISKWLEIYNQIYPENDIYFFSFKTNKDPAYEKLYDKITWVPFHSMTEPVNTNDISNAIFVFDDTDAGSSVDLADYGVDERALTPAKIKTLKKQYSSELDELIKHSCMNITKVGRASGISILLTSHVLQDGSWRVRDFYNECTFAVLFGAKAPKKVSRFLTAYTDFSAKQRSEIVEMGSQQYHFIYLNKLSGDSEYVISPHKIKLFKTEE